VENSGRDIFGFAVTFQGIQTGEFHTTPTNKGRVVRAMLPAMQGECVGAGKSGVAECTCGVGPLVAMERYVCALRFMILWPRKVGQ